MLLRAQILCYVSNFLLLFFVLHLSHHIISSAVLSSLLFCFFSPTQKQFSQRIRRDYNTIRFVITAHIWASFGYLRRGGMRQNTGSFVCEMPTVRPRHRASLISPSVKRHGETLSLSHPCVLAEARSPSRVSLDPIPAVEQKQQEWDDVSL